MELAAADAQEGGAHGDGDGMIKGGRFLLLLFSLYLFGFFPLFGFLPILKGPYIFCICMLSCPLCFMFMSHVNFCASKSVAFLVTGSHVVGTPNEICMK